jgi:hypothetical protein
MAVTDLPEDLIAFLRGGSPRTLSIGYGEMVDLVALEELCVETLEVTPNLSPCAHEGPHRFDGGYYAVPAINLVNRSPRSSVDFPAWLLLWIPDEGRYGSFDLDHGDLMMFAPEIAWKDIASDPEPFVRASDGEDGGPVSIESLRPWPRYPYIVPV